MPARPRAGRLKRPPGALSPNEAGLSQSSAFRRSLSTAWYCTATPEGLCVRPGANRSSGSPARRAPGGQCNTNRTRYGRPRASARGLPYLSRWYCTDHRVPGVLGNLNSCWRRAGHTGPLVWPCNTKLWEAISGMPTIGSNRPRLAIMPREAASGVPLAGGLAHHGWAWGRV